MTSKRWSCWQGLQKMIIILIILTTIFRERVLMMTDEQKEIFDLVMDSVARKLPLQLFIDARGGCGKTFTLEAILAGVRSSEPGGAVALAMATTGLAANLLPLGRTFHSRMKVILFVVIFKVGQQLEQVSLDPTDEGCFSISAQSDLSKLIKRAIILMVDEATLKDRRNFDKFEATMRDITGCDLPWGGKIVIFCGDFRLPNSKLPILIVLSGNALQSLPEPAGPPSSPTPSPDPTCGKISK